MEQLFDDHYQLHFLTHMLRDSQFLSHVIDDVKPELFTNELAQRIARITIDHGKDQQAAPATLIFSLLDNWRKKGLVSEAAHKNLTSYADTLFALQLQNREYLLRKFDEFHQHQVFSRNIIPAAKAVKEGNFDKAKELVTAAFTHRPKRGEDLGRQYDSDPTKRIERRRHQDHESFWLLMPELDRHLQGSMRGELFIWQSQRSSAGKSAAMVLCARSFVFQGKNTLIISLEMSEEKYEDRLDMAIAGLPKEALGDRASINHAVTRMFKRGGNLWIKQFPGQLTTVSDLRRYVQQLENVHNFHPDVIIIDYADELAPEAGIGVDNSFAAGKQIYSHLRGWAVKDNFFCMSAMQSNRSAMDSAVADQEHAGESLAKMWIADTVVSINRTAEEASRGLTNCHIVKHREGPARMSVQIHTDFSTMQFWRRAE